MDRRCHWSVSCAILLLGAAALIAQDDATGREEGHRVQTGDILGVYVEGVLGSPEAGPPVFVPTDPSRKPFVGYPIWVRGDGSISLPWIPAINVHGQTLSGVQEELEHSYGRLQRVQHAGLGDKLPEIVVTLLQERQADKPSVYRARRGDVLGIFINGILGGDDEHPPVHLNVSGTMLPSMGYPIPVRQSGIIALPFTEPINVVNCTLAEIASRIRTAYLVDREILRPDRARIFVTPMWLAPTDCLPMRREHRLKPGDTIATIIEDRPDEKPSVLDRELFGHDLIHVHEDGCNPPTWGFPIPVLANGTIALPLIPPVKVEGLTLTEAEKAILREYCIDTTILRPPPLMMLSLMSEQRRRVGVRRDLVLNSDDLLCIALLPGERDRSSGVFYFPRDRHLAPCFGRLFPVLPDGSVILPGLGRLDAQGKTPNELEQTIVAKCVENGRFRDYSNYVFVRVGRRHPR